MNKSTSHRAGSQGQFNSVAINLGWTLETLKNTRPHPYPTTSTSTQPEISSPLGPAPSETWNPADQRPDPSFPSSPTPLKILGRLLGNFETPKAPASSPHVAEVPKWHYIPVGVTLPQSSGWPSLSSDPPHSHPAVSAPLDCPQLQPESSTTPLSHAACVPICANFNIAGITFTQPPARRSHWIRGKTAWKEILECERTHTWVHTHASTDTTHAHVHVDTIYHAAHTYNTHTHTETTQYMHRHTCRYHTPHITHIHHHTQAYTHAGRNHTTQTQTHMHTDIIHHAHIPPTHTHTRNHTTPTETHMHTRTTQHTQTPTHRHTYTTQHSYITHTYTHSTNHRHFTFKRNTASVEAWDRMKRCAEGVAMNSEGNTEAAHGNPRG